MSTWSLAQLLSGLHDDIQQRLERVRKSFGHPGTKGDASESVWLGLLNSYLPQRYQAAKAHVVDSRGAFSDHRRQHFALRPDANQAAEGRGIGHCSR